VQQMMKLLLGLTAKPTPHDAADALAVAICHIHSRARPEIESALPPARSRATSWRQYVPGR